MKKEQYPSQDGIPLSPYDLGYTMPTWEQINTPRTIQNHHVAYPYQEYADNSLDFLFRGLVRNVYPLLIDEHQRGGTPEKDIVPIHKAFFEPEKPSDIIMVQFLDDYIEEKGVLHVVDERRTYKHYVVELPVWEEIRKDFM